MDHAPGTKKHAHSASSIPHCPPLSPLASPQSGPTGSPAPPSLPSLPSPLTTPKTEVAQPTTPTLSLVTLAAVATASSSLYFGTPSSTSSSPSPQPANMTVATIAQENLAQTVDASKRHHGPDQSRPQHEQEELRHPYHHSMNHRGPSTEGLPPFQRRPSSPFNNDNNSNYNNNYVNNNNNQNNNINNNSKGSSDYENERDRWNRARGPVPEEGSHAYARSVAQKKEGDHEVQSSSHPYHHQEPRIHGDHLGERGHSADSTDPVEGEDQDGPDGEAMSDDDNLEDDESEENEEGSSTSKDNNSVTAKSEEGSDSLVIAMYGARRPAVKVRSMFVDKLFKMVEDPAIQHLISWAKEGDMFYVYNCIKLSDTILPKFFKHNNWQSFVRQLNMYGFHKIYRYDREESNMNRKNPETQRWQFYHPHFQRDFPHLRKNIKRKSARSMNTAPATSRVVFEHGKGYFLQRNDRSRSNSGEGISHSQQAAQQDRSRSSEVRPASTKASPGHQHQMPPHPVQAQAPPSRHPSGHQSPIQTPLPHSPYAHSQQHSEGVQRPVKHQRQQSLYNARPRDSPNGVPERQYGPGSPGAQPRLHPSQSPRSGGVNGQQHPVRPPHLALDHGMEQQQLGGQHHFRSQSVPGVDHRKSSLPSRGPDPSHQSSPLGRQQDYPPSPRRSDGAISGIQASSSVEFDHRQAPPHRSHGSTGEPRVIVPGSSPRPSPAMNGSSFHAPPLAGSNGPAHPHHPYHQQQPSQSQPYDAQQRDRLHSMGGPVPKYSPQPTPTLPSAPLGSPTSPTDSMVIDPSLSGSSLIKDLEHRLHFVEDAYMSLRAYTQKLQQLQASQDRTIGWMRERIDYMTEAAQARRDPMATPPTPQSGTMFAVKRKAEIGSEDPRSRARYDSSVSRHESAGHPYYGVESVSSPRVLDGHPTNGEHYDSSRRQHASHPSMQNDHHHHHHSHHPHLPQQQHRMITAPEKI
ncbi:unnamed protein product [Mortierella alpina]